MISNQLIIENFFNRSIFDKISIAKYFQVTFLLSILFYPVLFAQNITNISYVESDEIYANPERGFSFYTKFPVTIELVDSLRLENVTQINRIYNIPQFNNSPLSTDFLNLIEADLYTARAGGVKLVIRFSYTDDPQGDDAPLNVILAHIDQVESILMENFDVISYMEAGFIGAWGEWHSSSNNLDNTADRSTVLFALLDALPAERAVVVRTPNYKRQIFEIDDPLNFTNAFNGSNRARTGAHNDCFLSNETDCGTYLANDIEGDKNYLNLDNRFVPQGGETCAVSDYSGCSNALADLNRMHWSVLNNSYHPDVLSGWVTSGCMDEIKRRLGYRFLLVEGGFTNQVKPGGKFDIFLKLFNNGFASPFNPRNLEFILRNRNTHNRYRMISEEDPRFWVSGDSVLLNITAGIMGMMPEGDYELLLHLADPVERIHDHPEYSIRLANENTWEDSTGYNNLQVNVEVNSEVQGDDYFGDLYFLEITSGNNNSTSILIDGVFEDWAEIENLDIDPDNETYGDALNSSVDLVDMWIADDDNYVYISYSLDSSFADGYFYHVFIDADNNSLTGYNLANSNSGFDLMVENDKLFKYVGQNSNWAWEQNGFILSKKGISDQNRIEMLISKNTLESFGTGNSFGLIFHVNDLDVNVDDDYAPDAYQQRSYAYNYLVTSIKLKNNKVQSSKFEIKVYPNAFNNQVNILFRSSAIKILYGSIYDILGRRLKYFSKEDLGSNKITWDGKTDSGTIVGSGIYFFQLATTSGYYSAKLMLIK
jgi:hypothetical protein